MRSTAAFFFIFLKVVQSGHQHFHDMTTSLFFFSFAIYLSTLLLCILKLTLALKVFPQCSHRMDIPSKWFASIWFLIAWLVPHFHTLCKSELLPASRFVLFLVQLYCGFSPSLTLYLLIQCIAMLASNHYIDCS